MNQQELETDSKPYNRGTGVSPVPEKTVWSQHRRGACATMNFCRAAISLNCYHISKIVCSQKIPSRQTNCCETSPWFCIIQIMELFWKLRKLVVWVCFRNSSRHGFSNNETTTNQLPRPRFFSFGVGSSRAACPVVSRPTPGCGSGWGIRGTGSSIARDKKDIR